MSPPARSHPPPLKRLGQHFLADDRVLGDIADALAPTAADTVLEVGPGRGALTALLAERAGKVIAVEIDRALIVPLRERFDAARVHVIEGDFLRMDVAPLVPAPYLFAGNVPYYITTPIVFKLLEAPRPARAVLLVQREVADRMAAGPGSKLYGALSVNVQCAAAVESIRNVPATAFRPRPTVESAVVRLAPRVDAVISADEAPAFRAFVQRVFAGRRKQLQRILRTMDGLRPEEAEAAARAVGTTGDVRPEQLSPEQFVALYRALRLNRGS